MEARALIAAIRGAGAAIQPEGEKIRFSPVSALPDGLVAALRQHRDEVHLWLCAEMAALPDPADEEARLEFADESPRPGYGWRPRDGDALAAGLLAGFNTRRPGSANEWQQCR